MKRVNKKTLKNLTSLMLICFVSSLAFFVVTSGMDLFLKEDKLRSIVCSLLFSADMLFLVLFMSCVYGIRALHEDFGTVWLLLFFRILLIFGGMVMSELKHLSELSAWSGMMQSCSYLMEYAALLCFVIAYKIMIGGFAQLLEKTGMEKQAANYRKGSILYLSIGISAVMFCTATVFVPAEGRSRIIAGILKTAALVMRLIVILLNMPIFFALRDAIGNIWRNRVERAQEGRRIR